MEEAAGAAAFEGAVTPFARVSTALAVSQCHPRSFYNRLRLNLKELIVPRIILVI